MTLSRATLITLRAAVVLLCLLHALFTPVYEGPDEPFHLARARMFARAPLADALAGKVVDADLVRSLQAWPCGPAMQTALGCPAFGSESASFNILETSRRSETGVASSNYQAHQPPLYYLVSASLVELFAPGIETAPESQILLLRLAAVLLVGYVLCVPLRKLGKGNAPFEALVLMALLFPGSAESLVRVSNDVGVFAWAVLLLAAVHSGDRLHPGSTAVLAGVGPLLKLTAFPIVAYAAVLVWRKRGWRAGTLVGAAGLAVLPLQWLRGWAWGGTLEANAQLSGLGTLPEILFGLLHSAATFFKTAVWLGGWSFFRPPAWLLLAAPLFGLTLILRGFRRRRFPPDLFAHFAALALALAGFVVFARGQRRIFGVWGGVGGWYLWGWVPWLALFASDVVEIRPGRERELVVTAIVGATAMNLVWFQVAYRIYG